MRLLAISNLCPPDGYGGYERQSREIIDELAKQGHDVTVLTCPVSTRSAYDKFEPNVHRLLQLANEYLPFTNEPSLLKTIKLQSRVVSSHNISVLVNELRAVRPDAVLLCNIFGLGGQQLIATLNLLGVPWLWSLAEVVPASLFDLDELTDLLAMFPLKKTSDVFVLDGNFVSPSRKLYEFIEEEGCRLEGERHVVPYWVDAQRAVPARRDYRRGQVLRMCSVGYVSTDKGIDILLDAMKILCDQGESNFVLDIYGAGDVEELAKRAAELNLFMVHFHGFRSADELDVVYAEHDVMLFPAKLKEPFGNVTLEGALRGCVPVMFDGCGGAESLPHLDVAVHVKRDAKAFADAVTAILHGETDLDAISKRISDYVRKNFAIESAAARYIEIFAKMAVPFAPNDDELNNARLLAMYNERIIFAHLETELSRERNTIAWYQSEVGALKSALESAKNGIVAYEQALTGEQHKLAAAQDRLKTIENSRIWKIRNLLKPD